MRALIDDRGENVAEAGPSVPVEILGFDSAPEAGDPFAVVESEGRAREITDYRVRKRRQTLGSAGTARTLEQMMQQLKEAGRKEFPLLVKGDVQGSVEAIVGALRKLGTDEVEARIVHSGVGGITESDVALANASKAVVVGFNVRANAQAKALADQTGVEIRYYNIIYDLVDDVKAAMSGLLAPTLREIFLGNAQILEVFNISKVGKVAGCRVTDGKVERGAKVRLIRDNVVIHEGTLSTLKRFKDEVREVPAGQECGMAFANYQDIRAGDVIECFNVETIARHAVASCLVVRRVERLTGSAPARADPSPHTMANRRSEKTTGPSQRQLRVGELIRHALAEMLIARRDPRRRAGRARRDRPGGAHVAGPAARHRLRDAARRQGHEAGARGARAQHAATSAARSRTPST